MAEPDHAQGLESLVVWKKALQFAVFLSGEIIKKFPVEEKYALSSQLRRACQSIPANIAEGYGRFYYQEGIRFAYIARGSLEETRSHVQFAHQMAYITSDEFSLINNRIEEIRRLINGYIKYLKKTKQGISEPGVHYYSTTQMNIPADDDISDE